MNKSISAAIVSVFAAFVLSPPAVAQTPTLQSAWVSGQGSDTPMCGAVTTACRTFQYTHDNIVIAGGQIRVHDPAGYSALTITKSISIINDGVGVAAISAPTGSAIKINAPGATVILKGLSLDGAGTGSVGIDVFAAYSVIVTNAMITGFNGAEPSGAGIYLNNNTVVYLFDSFISANYHGVELGADSILYITHNKILGNNTDAYCNLNVHGINTTKDNILSTDIGCALFSTLFN